MDVLTTLHLITKALIMGAVKSTNFIAACQQSLEFLKVQFNGPIYIIYVVGFSAFSFVH